MLNLAGCAWLDEQIPSFGYNNGYQPTQPIPYDHSLHAGKLQIPCLNCHVMADKAPAATIPSLNVCMNCHRSVNANSDAIKQLTRAHDQNRSIAWQKVTLLPDFVMFNHEPHVQAGVRCQTCHGEIQQMQEVYQYSDLSMGWCVNCHRNPANTDLGWEHKMQSFGEDNPFSEGDTVAPTNCGTCHY